MVCEEPGVGGPARQRKEGKKEGRGFPVTRESWDVGLPRALGGGEVGNKGDSF